MSKAVKKPIKIKSDSNLQTESKKQTVDALIIGAGLYGLYSACLLAKQGKKVAVLEYDREPMQRATYVNQARLHLGYHYPRSLATAKKSAKYFHRFNEDFKSAINQKFQKIYAVAKHNSMTDGNQFQKFCQQAGIPCQEVVLTNFFNPDHIEAAFLTKEYAFDALKIKEYFVKKINQFKKIKIYYQARLFKANKKKDHYELKVKNGLTFYTPQVINATYASINQILNLFQFPLLTIKYEICEVILCQVSPNIKKYGLTVMDGPFFSVMPFGLTPYHSLTSVSHTPHTTSYDVLPKFPCQKYNRNCTPHALENCNLCPNQPGTSYAYMRQLTKKYLQHKVNIKFVKTLFSIKPILLSSELDDSRPTIIKTYSENPSFIAVFSGKINTIYDLDEVIK